MNRMASAASLASYNKIYLSADNVVTWSFAWCPNEDMPLRGQSPGRKVRPPPVCAWGRPALSGGAASSPLAQGSGLDTVSWGPIQPGRARDLGQRKGNLAQGPRSGSGCGSLLLMIPGRRFSHAGDRPWQRRGDAGGEAPGQSPRLLRVPPTAHAHGWQGAWTGGRCSLANPSHGLHTRPPLRPPMAVGAPASPKAPGRGVYTASWEEAHFMTTSQGAIA